MGVWHERGEAKIDHLVKDWLWLLLIFHHQAWMTEANAGGVDEACRERRVSRMELAYRHATRDYRSRIPARRWLCLRMIVQFSVIAAAINSCNLRSNIYSLECVFSTDPIKLRILWAAVPRDAAIFSASASILPRMSRQTASLISDFAAKK